MAFKIYFFQIFFTTGFRVINFQNYYYWIWTFIKPFRNKGHEYKRTHICTLKQSLSFVQLQKSSEELYFPWRLHLDALIAVIQKNKNKQKKGRKKLEIRIEKMESVAMIMLRWILRDDVFVVVNPTSLMAFVCCSPTCVASVKHDADRGGARWAESVQQPAIISVGLWANCQHSQKSPTISAMWFTSVKTKAW